MNPHEYSIVVRLQKIDGEDLYVGRVTEFPDVKVYESNFEDAYQSVARVISDLIDMAAEIGHGIPHPTEEDEEYSGKMTFRPGRTLHKQIAEAAKLEDLSQNQFLCNVVSAAVSRKRSLNDVRAMVRSELLQMTSRQFSYLQKDHRRAVDDDAFANSRFDPIVTSGTGSRVFVLGTSNDIDDDLEDLTGIMPSIYAAHTGS